MRADGQRNRDALLTAAVAVFEERGPDAPLDDIARRAGVGNATLYRHFPTRRDLLAAVFADEVTALRAYAELLCDEEPPADALHAWLRAVATHLAGKHDLALAAGGAWYAAMHETASALLAAAQRTGAVAPAIDAADLLALARGIALAGTGPSQVDRLLDVVRRGVEA